MNGQPSSQPSSSSSTNTALGWVDSETGILHQNCRMLIFVGREFLGEFIFDPGAHPEMRWRRSGAAYFCYHCGEIWARVVMLDARGRQEAFEPERVACEKHWDQWNVAGSLLAGPLAHLLPMLPEAALKREFRIHLTQLEK